jgi:hypothetical protein
MKSVNSRCFGLRDEVDRSPGGSSKPSGTLTCLLGLVFGRVAPYGGYGDDKFQGCAGNDGRAKLLAESVHQMVPKSGDVVRDEPIGVSTTPSSCNLTVDHARVLEIGIQITTRVSKMRQQSQA